MTKNSAMKMVAVLASAFWLATTGTTAQATVKPNSLFSENAVLQQDIRVPVWGTAADGESVTVAFQKQIVTTTAKDGQWMVYLEPLDAGGPYAMTISGENTIELQNILVGQVWIASGQSNMWWPLSQNAHGAEAVAASKDTMLRLLTVPEVPSETPVGDAGVSWKECSPETSPEFSAVAYFFARNLRRALNVPVGIIHASHGGTRIESWIPARAVKNASELREWAKVFTAKSIEIRNRPTVNYNGIIAPLMPFAFRGVIWYQGETNAGLSVAYAYRDLLTTMIQTWREDWKQGDFPFLFVQLPPYDYSGKIATEPQESIWAEFREAQLLVSQTCPQTAMVVLTDYGDPVNIHPLQKEPVGARLELAAEAIAYGRATAYQGPIYKSMTVNGDQVILHFDCAEGGLVSKDGELQGFTVAGADKVFVNAEASIQDSSVIVRSPHVAAPVAVRYGWANCPAVNLFNKAGFPATPFRTDSFPLLTQPK